MERIINGDYRSLGSTRDITDIKPHEFACIIASLQHYNKSLEFLLSSSHEQRKTVFDMSKEVGLCDADVQQSLESFTRNEDKLVADYNLTYEILAQINKPYPGAEY